MRERRNFKCFLILLCCVRSFRASCVLLAAIKLRPLLIYMFCIYESILEAIYDSIIIKNKLHHILLYVVVLFIKSSEYQYE